MAAPFFASRCTLQCDSGLLVDSEFVCAAPDRKEHARWAEAQRRIAHILREHPTAYQATVITVVREPIARLVSHWLHCEREHLKWATVSRGGAGYCTHGSSLPRRGVPFLSNESFEWFLERQQHGAVGAQHGAIGARHGAARTEEEEGFRAEEAGYRAARRGWFRTSNLQVGMLASVPDGEPVTHAHLEQVKALLARSVQPRSPLLARGVKVGVTRWVVGTTETLPEFYMELAALAGRPVTRAVAQAAIGVANTAAAGASRQLRAVASGRAAALNTLDLALYRWAQERQARMMVVGK